MVSLVTFVDRVSDLEQDLKQQLQKVQSYLEPNQGKSFTEKFEEDQTRRLELIEAWRNEINKALAREVEKSLDSSIISVEKFSTEVSNEDDFSDRKELIEELLELRNQAERLWRLTQLATPANEKEFQAALMWASQQGEDAEFDKLQIIKENLPYNSAKIQNSTKIQYLLDYARQQIKKRLPRYKVLCAWNELEQYSQSLEIIDRYPAFTIVVGSMMTIGKIKERIPVEQLPKPHSGEPPMPDRREQIVRFDRPVRQSWKQSIEAMGAKILQPIGRLELVVSVPDPNLVEQIRAVEGVAEVTPYVPKIQVQSKSFHKSNQPVTKEAIAAARLNAAKNPPQSQNQSATIPGILIANFFTETDRDRAAQELEAHGIEIVDRVGTTQLILDVSATDNGIESLELVTQQLGLQSVGEKTIPKLFNQEACTLIAEGVIPCNPEPTLGLTGREEIIAIADTGLDTGDPELLHPDFQGRVIEIKSYPIGTASFKKYLLNFGEDDGAADKYSGHGTHVAGSALGSGEQARAMELSSIPTGMAADAKLIFQAVEQTTKWNLEGKLFYLEAFGIMPPPSELFGIPDHLAELFEYAYEKGAKIHSNSWGKVYPGIYDISDDHSLDQFVWQHKDFLVIVAAGNSGRHSSDGIRGIDQETVSSPGTAKNCLTVGASENDLPGQFSVTYGQFWSHDFPYEPFRSDGLVDSIDDIAAFSGRGPCPDGRCKPDVIAPGTFILSARSSQIAENNFAWGAYAPAKRHYMYMGGTSMATPLVAGCAALVRQYLREKHQPSMPNPSAALVKATLIHSAQYINYRFAYPSSAPWVDNEQGWGRIDLKQVLNPLAPRQVCWVDETNGLNTGEKRGYQFEITDRSVLLKATLVYTDYPGESLINNLNLVLYSPSGQRFVGNDFAGTHEPDTTNNVEGIVVESPETGQWKVEIMAEAIQAQQDFALVVSGGLINFGESSG